MTAKDTEPPYKKLEGKKALTLEGQNKIDLEITISRGLKELWDYPDDYVYDNMHFDNTKFSEILSEIRWEDGSQMTFLELETARTLQELYRGYFTRDGVRERLTANGNTVSESRVEAEYAQNYLAWQHAQVITRIEQNPRRGSMEHAAHDFGNLTRKMGRENILLRGSNYLHNRIAERARAMSEKHHKLSDHVLHYARAGIHHGVGHIKGEFLKQLLGGPVGTTVSAVSTARSLVFSMDRFLGDRSVFMGNDEWKDIKIDPDMHLFETYYGRLAGILGKSRLLDANGVEIPKFKAEFDNPGRTQALILAMFMQQPYRKQVGLALPATFIREGGDYILARMPV